MPVSALSCKIQVYQKSVLSNRAQININDRSDVSRLPLYDIDRYSEILIK